MSDVQLTARQGEPLDALLWRSFGKAGGVTEAVLATNPGLARIAHALPEGHSVTVPAAATLTAPADQQLVQLWD